MKSLLINRAISIAEQSTYKYRLGALLLKNNKIINAKENKSRYVGFMKKYDEYPSLHAETHVMKGVSKEVLLKCSILVIRIDALGNIKNSKPCLGCRKFAYSRGIKKFYFFDDEANFYEWKDYY